MAPGGGSISAYVGALGVSLGTMVANLSAHKAGWDDNGKFSLNGQKKGKLIKINYCIWWMKIPIHLIKLLRPFECQKVVLKKKNSLKASIEEATKYATEIPFQVMETAYQSIEVMQAMIKEGLQNSLSDAGVGVLCARTAVLGAYFNVRINAKDIKDKAFVDKILAESKEIYKMTLDAESAAMDVIDSRM